MSGMLAVALGGALGALARYQTTQWVTRFVGHGFPWGTLAVNVAGSFVLGLLVALFARVWQPPPEVRLLLVTGLLGGFTTFSALSLELAAMVGRQQWVQVVFYAGGSVVIGVMALMAGMKVGRLSL